MCWPRKRASPTFTSATRPKASSERARSSTTRLPWSLPTMPSPVDTRSRRGADMEKMKQWSMLTALGVVGVLAAGWFLLVTPQHAHAKDLRTQAQAVQTTTSQLNGQIQQLKAQQTGVAAQQRTLAHIATQIPDNPALPTLIRQLSAAAHDSGVTLVSLAPSQPTAVTAAGTPTAAGATSALAQIPIAVSVTGSYFNIES